jgi:hypothetical protein
VKLGHSLPIVLGLLHTCSKPATGQGFNGLSATALASTLTISTVIAAGQQPLSVSNTSTTYTVTTFFGGAKKITAGLNAAMPANVTLTATYNAPSGAASTGPVNLDTTARDMVTNITNEFNSSNGITYSLSATVLAGVVPSQSRTVTLTLTNYP